MNIALVDDEKMYLDEMDKLCREFGNKNGTNIHTWCYPEGNSFLRDIGNTRFHIVFMDIYMEGTDGITTARKLRETDPSSILIFFTSSGEHMPEAFSCHAFEYISKPIDRPRVEKVLDDAVKLLSPPEKYIEVLCDRKAARVFLNDIVYAVTDAHYLEIFLRDGSKLRSRMTVPEFLSLIGSDSRFILANRGVILNAGHILFFENNCCVMDSGAKLPIKVKDAGRVEQAVLDYNFDSIRRSQNTGNGGSGYGI